MIIIDILVCILAILLIAVVMMQNSKDDIKDAFSGEKSELFKNQKSRGIEKVLKISTSVIAVLFIVSVIASRNWPR